MCILRLFCAGVLLATAAQAADIIPGDARRGAQLFDSEQCVQCHSVNGHGGSSAPDLGRRVDRNFTPSVMASLMWNHAPAMWSAMGKQGIMKPTLSQQSAADLFAYFMSARFFEKPGDAGRGKQVFTSKHCAECHGITTVKEPGAPPVAKWESLADPVVLAQQMWNHGAKMKQVMAQKNFAWSEITAQELTDLLVYLQNLPQTRNLAQNFQFGPSESGEQLFQSKGCRPDACPGLPQWRHHFFVCAAQCLPDPHGWGHADELSELAAVLYPVKVLTIRSRQRALHGSISTLR